ncbi:MAG: phosphopentomutase [Calditrichia bacterium]
MKRAVIIVLDGVGIGEAPDASQFGDAGSNTLGNLAQAVGGLQLPNLQKLGLGNIARLKGIPTSEKPMACFGRMQEQSPGKDSTTGHWEMAGCILDFAFPTYPDGFPEEVLQPFREKTGRGVLGNKAASGTEIIQELGEAHLQSGDLIVYTSADSVFQIAAHEQVVPLEELYGICEIAREILQGRHGVSRVIARPFVGDKAGNFTRTADRRDFSLKPPKPLLQTCLQQQGMKTVAIGKIDDLYAGVGWDRKIHSKKNAEGLRVLLEQLRKVREGFIMINLVDFDMLWGHRNNPQGFYRELQAFDNTLSEILPLITENDLLVITADHGNDPTTASTDHSREYVPLLIYGPALQAGVELGIRQSFADLGKTVAQAMGAGECPLDGSSFWELIR